jgi:hypothetical protein
MMKEKSSRIVLVRRKGDVFSCTCTRTCCKSTSPIVAGLKIFDNFGGHFIIMFLYKSEYLNRRKICDDASMATTIGAWNSGASTAWIDVPKHKVMIMSMAMQRNAKCKSTTLLPEVLLWRSKAAQSACVLEMHNVSALSMAEGEKERDKTSLRVLASA